MGSLNKVMLIGYCGRDPESRQTSTNEKLVTTSLATTERFNDKQTQEPREQTEWHQLVFFGKVAEIAQEYVRKGSQIYVEGKIKTRKWTDQKGHERTGVDIVVSSLKLLGSRGESARQDGASGPEALSNAKRDEVLFRETEELLF